MALDCPECQGDLGPGWDPSGQWAGWAGCQYYTHSECQLGAGLSHQGGSKTLCRKASKLQRLQDCRQGELGFHPYLISSLSLSLSFIF